MSLSRGIWGHVPPGNFLKINTLGLNFEAILTGICKCELTVMQLNEYSRKNKITKYVKV